MAFTTEELKAIKDQLCGGPVESFRLLGRQVEAAALEYIALREKLDGTSKAFVTAYEQCDSDVVHDMAFVMAHAYADLVGGQ